MAPFDRSRAVATLAVLLCFASRAASGQAAPPPRLSGVLLAPGGGVAILVRDGSSYAAEVGDVDGVYRVASIAAYSVTLAGPDGPVTLTLRDRGGSGVNSERPGASAAELGSVALGLRAGRAGVRYEACVEKGLLPRMDVPASVKLGRVVDAMANLPRREGSDWRLDPPARDMAMWTRLGLRAAEREPRPEPSPASCQAAAADWADAARHIGVP